ncbi:hypothetical protein D3C80_1126800 [compost metagenome]
MPVLSVQITVAAPSASTAGRWRISAFCRAMRWVAMASARVTLGSRPSGTLATMMPMAKIRLPQSGRPSAWPSRKNSTPMAIASSASWRDRWMISRCRGEWPSLPVWVRRAILPNSVCMPVANTRARP